MRVGSVNLGTRIVDDLNEGGTMVWVVFGGAVPGRMFIPEDEAQYTVLPPTSLQD
ncbi:hypothetical protein [Arthrobacter sp. SPG23]|uniref:hypothetical protein n=1 Tax=Arthrobacter sp. SPG23 TaxID=1610703 RepID=UPI000A812B58|nr:hypothetical protein [Arthrobacter sp. SPG23]